MVSAKFAEIRLEKLASKFSHAQPSACHASRRKSVVKNRIRTKHWKVTFVSAWLIWLLDYLTKQWALTTLPGKNIKVIGSFLQLQLTTNTGAAFSIGAKNGGVALSFFAISASCIAVYYAPFLTSRGWSFVLALVLGGSIGNLTDRAFNEPGLFRGSVTDWIVLPHWPTFNIADTAIVIAALLAFILTARNIAPIESAKNA